MRTYLYILLAAAVVVTCASSAFATPRFSSQAEADAYARSLAIAAAQAKAAAGAYASGGNAYADGGEGYGVGLGVGKVHVEGDDVLYEDNYLASPAPASASSACNTGGASATGFQNAGSIAVSSYACDVIEAQEAFAAVAGKTGFSASVSRFFTATQLVTKGLGKTLLGIIGLG